MSDWSDLGLPYPEAPEYGYTVDVGLLRTPFAAAQPRQLRKWYQARRTFTLHFLLSSAQLRTATNFLESHGFSSFTIELLSGVSINLIGVHEVRLVKDFSVSAVAYNTYKLSAEVESQAVEELPPEPACSEVVFFKQVSGVWTELGSNPTLATLDLATTWLAVGVRLLSGDWAMLPYEFIVNEPPDENSNSDLLVCTMLYSQQNLNAFSNYYSYGTDPTYWEFEARFAQDTILVNEVSVRVLWVFQAVRLNPALAGSLTITPRPLNCLCSQEYPSGTLTIGP